MDIKSIDVPLLIDAVMFRDELVHDERHSLPLGRRLLGFAAVGVSEVDDVSTARTEVTRDGHRRHDDDQEDQCY